MARKLEPAVKVSDELKKMLNDALAIEIAASVQCMWQYVQVIGTKGVAVAGKFKETAIAEMKQAEEIAERLWYLNGTPTTQLAPINVGQNLKEFLEIDANIEEEGIQLYKKVIDQAEREGDVTTAFMIKEILEVEEGHHDLFTSMLEEI